MPSPETLMDPGGPTTSTAAITRSPEVHLDEQPGSIPLSLFSLVGENAGP